MINLRVITPEGLYLQEPVSKIHAASTEGEFSILPGHVPIVLYMEPTKLTITKPDGKQEDFAISGGFLHVEKDEARLLTDAIEGSREIDLIRAQQAYKRARERLERKDSNEEFARSELSLKKAINRIKVSTQSDQLPQ